MTAIHKRPDGSKHLVVILGKVLGMPGFLRCASDENKNEHLTVHRDTLTILEDGATEKSTEQVE